MASGSPHRPYFSLRSHVIIGLIQCASLSSALASAPQSSVPTDEFFARLRKLAQERSYDLRIAQAADEQAGAARYTAWTRWMPSVSLTLSQTRSQDYSILTSGSLGSFSSMFTPTATSLSRWSLDGSLPLFQRSVQLGVEQAIAEKQLASHRLKVQVSGMDWRLRQALGNYLLGVYREITVGNSVELARKNLQEARLRFELGQKTKVDVLRAQANLLSLESRNIVHHQQRSTDLNSLLEYSGLTLKDLEDAGINALISDEKALVAAIDDFTRSDRVLEAIQPYVDEKLKPDSIDQLVAERSPNYAAARSEQQTSLSRAKSLNAAEYPALSLRASLNKQTPDWSNSFTSDNVSYSFGAYLTIPIFQGGSFYSTLAESRNSGNQAELKAERDVLRLRNEVENDRIRIRSLLSTLEAQKVNLEQNEEIVRLSFKSYQLGKATIVELLGSQNDLIESKINLAKTKVDLSVLARKLAWNLGLEAGVKAEHE